MDLFDKVASDLQTGVSVGDNGIGGTLNFIDDYSSAGYTGDEKSGHFLVLHAEALDGATITCEIIGGVHGPVTVDPSDGLVICRIKNTQQQIKLTATKAGAQTITKTFRLNGLTLA